MTDPKDLVRSSYDRISHVYRPDDGGDDCTNYHAWLADLLPRLPDTPHVLDLGCGCGIPVAQILATDARVTGVDISPVQIERARRAVPSGEFLCADMCEVDFPPSSFDAVVSLYAIIHVPVDEHEALLSRIHRWLKPGGWMLCVLGHRAWTGTEDSWLVDGATMYWSHADAGTYRRWLTGLGFELVRDEFVPEDDSGHQLFLARRAQ